MPTPPGYEPPLPAHTSHAIAAEEIARLRARCRELHSALTRLAATCKAQPGRIGSLTLADALREADRLVARGVA